MTGAGEDAADLRRARGAAFAVAVLWPVTLVALLSRSVPLTASVASVLLVAMVELVACTSRVAARGSSSRPAGAREVSRVSRAIEIGFLVAGALVPVLGVLGWFGLDTATAQVDTPRDSYTYRVDYDAVRPIIRPVLVALCIASTTAVVMAVS